MLVVKFDWYDVPDITLLLSIYIHESQIKVFNTYSMKNTFIFVGVHSEYFFYA